MSQAPARPYEIKRTLGFLVARSQRLMNQQLEAGLAEFGLTVQQFVALQLIFEGHVSCGRDIARTLGLDTGSTTRLIDQLAEKDLVVRTRDGCDRRQVTLALTDAGRAAAGAAQAATADHMQSLLAGFGAAEADTLLEYLSRLVTRLEEPIDA